MPHTATIDKEFKQEAYFEALKAEKDVSRACRLANMKNTDDVRNWRRRDKVFEEKELAIAQEFGIDIWHKAKKAVKRERRVAAPKVKSSTPKPKPHQTNNVGNSPSAPPPKREDRRALIDFYADALREAKRAKGTYQKSDEQQIAVTARYWAIVEKYERNIFEDDVPIVRRSITQAELDPLWKEYPAVLKLLQRSLQSLGLNYDAVGYAIKQKKKGTLDDVPQYDDDGRLIGTQGVYS